YIFPFSPVQYQVVIQHLPKPESSYLLEIGSGTGSLTLELAQTCAHTVGIDIDESMISFAHEKQHHYKKQAHIIALNMLDIDLLFTPEYFDVIFSFGNGLVHLLSPQEILDVLSASKQLLRQGGHLLLQIINYDRILENKISFLPTIENEHITFERRYNYMKDEHLIKFTTELTDKTTGEISVQQVQLYPLIQTELQTLLLEAGFTEVSWYGGFDLSPFTKDSIQLLAAAK
nr:methyltransferase domain-containing protein [Spirochaetales bacterium]